MSTHPDEPTSPGERAAAEATAKPVPAWAIHRRLYDWVLSFAHHKHSGWALFLIAFAESSFFPVPPDVLLAPLCLGHRRKAMRFATICTAGSVAGAFLGYVIGFAFIAVALHIPGITQDKIDWLAGEFEHRGQLYVFVAVLTPIPFKLLTITAGFAKMNLAVFTIACVVGRAARFFAVAALLRWIGPKATPLIDKYFNLLCVLFVILLVGGFAVVKLLH